MDQKQGSSEAATGPGRAKRGNPVSVRFSDDQLQCVEYEARKRGLDVSSFVRMCALERTAWEPPLTKDD